MTRAIAALEFLAAIGMAAFLLAWSVLLTWITLAALLSLVR